jgi:hydroxymethylpyrimidine pyrophosphatase-like HAD family hydrolase
MRYLALATAYDGTLTKTGRLSADVLSALERLRASGRGAILVTNRAFHDIAWACPRLDLFDYVVAESGAVLHRPAAWETIGISGRRGAGTASAVERALREMRVPPEQLVAIAAEPGDEAFLAMAGFPVAIADASRMVKGRAKFVTRGSAGRGVVELIDELLRDDLRQITSSAAKIACGPAEAGRYSEVGASRSDAIIRAGEPC